MKLNYLMDFLIFLHLFIYVYIYIYNLSVQLEVEQIKKKKVEENVLRKTTLSLAAHDAVDEMKVIIFTMF